MKKRLRSWVLILAVPVVSVTLAACGSGSSSTDSTGSSSTAPATTEGGSSGGVSSEVKEIVAKYSQPITEWPGPNTPVTPPPGKKITVITCGSTGITCVRVANGAKAAAEALGYSVNVVDGKNDPSVWSSSIQQAVANGADGIVLAAVPPAVVPEQVKEARAKGVKVVSVLSNVGKGIPNVLLDFNRDEAAEATTAYLAEESGGDAHLLLVRDKEFPGPEAYFERIEELLPEYCPGCKVEDTVNFTLALVAQRLAGSVTSSLQTHPDIDTVMQPFDAITPFVVQGITQAGKKGQVQIIGEGADPPGVEAMEAGDMIESMGTPAEWMGWQSVDDLIRLFANKPVEEVKVPQRLVTAEDLPGPEGWQGDFDYQKEFERLWGVG